VREVEIGLEAGPVSASVHGEGTTAVVLGHGAGGNRRGAFLVHLAERLAAGGRRAVLYNFPYTERRRKVPDPPARLEAAAAAAAAFARTDLGAGKVVLGGKSMGGRIASQAVAAGTPADGLVFLGYPLHPPGRFDRLRDRHLDAVAAPMLFVQGTRDAFAREDLLAPVIARLGERAAWHRIEEGDHSFAVPKSRKRAAADVEAEIAAAIEAWLRARGL
jgi:predicted alpha/beta-hydrolase family hydrolase